MKIKCDGCGEEFMKSELHKTYDENYNLQKGILMCMECQVAGPPPIEEENVFSIKDAKEIVKAWEGIDGDRNYSPKVIEAWLKYTMKPAIDKLRKKIKNYEKN